MWLQKDDYLIDLDEVFRVRGIEEKKTDPSKKSFGAIFEFKRNASENSQWSKFFFRSEAERDEYVDEVGKLLKAETVELNVIEKLS